MYVQGPSPSLGITKKQVQHVDPLVLIMCAKCEMAVWCENCLSFKWKTVCPSSQSNHILGENQGHRHKCLYANLFILFNDTIDSTVGQNRTSFTVTNMARDFS